MSRKALATAAALLVVGGIAVLVWNRRRKAVELPLSAVPVAVQVSSPLALSADSEPTEPQFRKIDISGAGRFRASVLSAGKRLTGNERQDDEFLEDVEVAIKEAALDAKQGTRRTYKEIGRTFTGLQSPEYARLRAEEKAIVAEKNVALSLLEELKRAVLADEPLVLTGVPA